MYTIQARLTWASHQVEAERRPETSRKGSRSHVLVHARVSFCSPLSNSIAPKSRFLRLRAISSPSEVELRPSIPPQCPQKGLVLDPRTPTPTHISTRIAHTVNLTQTNLPRRIAIEFHNRSKDD